MFCGMGQLGVPSIAGKRLRGNQNQPLPFPLGSNFPTAVALLSFVTREYQDGEVLLHWLTGY